MSATTIEAARRVARGLELREKARHGGSREDARARIAGRLGWSPGTLYNLARDRLKKFDRDLREQLAAYAVRDLEKELAALTAELEAARALGVAPDQTRLARLATAIETAQRLHDDLKGIA